MDGLLLEDGSGVLLLEDGGTLGLEQQPAPVFTTGLDALLLEDGSGVLLLEDGASRLALEQQAARRKRGIPPARRPRTYYVRVGDRMYRVNPDDPRTLRTLYAATQAEAERVAAQEAEQAVQAAAEPHDAPEPEEVAQAVVRAEPVRAEPSVDLAALQAEIDAISAKVREVFAAAFQRELIAKLMQERMAREDDDAAAMLLLMD